MGAFSSTGFSPIAFSVDQVVPVVTATRDVSVIKTSPKRKEVNQRIILADGTAITVRVLDGLLIDDLLISGMKAEGYRVMTGIDAFPTIDRNLKDYLIKTGVIRE